MRSRCRSLVLLTLLLPPARGAGETAVVPRDEIEQLEAQLDRAVAQVSRPSVGIVVGRAEGARGYHIPGYGAVFVLSPRALPQPHGVLVQVGPGSVIQMEGPPPTPDRRIRIRSGGRAVPLDPDHARELAEIEAQVAAFQREAEEARQAAELELERLAIDVQFLLAPPPQGAVSPPPPPAAPRPVKQPTAPRSPVAPLPPPWRFWFESRETRDARAPEEVVADVRSAVIATLEAHGAQVSGLGPDEHLAVAVDFVIGGPFVSQTRPTKTLLVRARRKDLDERGRGKLSPEELRKRIEIVEY